jgi:hypothetical protein
MGHKKPIKKIEEVLAEFKFRLSGKHFYGKSDYDKIPLCKMSEVRDYWRNKADRDAQ